MGVSRRFVLLGGLAVGGAASSVFLMSGGSSEAAWFPSSDEIYRDPAAPLLGNPDGDVTLVEFFDYQCPFCRKHFEPMLDLVAADGGVRVLLRDWPIFGAASVRASQLAFGAAQSGEFATASSALMGIQGRLDEPGIDAALRGAGIDPDTADAQFAEKRDDWNAMLQRNERLAAAFNLPGTPAYFIGEDVYPGVIQDATLREAIARVRAGAA